MIDRVKIRDPLQMLCDRLGLEYKNVRELRIRPREVVATVYLIRDGRKYLADDGEPATVERVFPVST